MILPVKKQRKFNRRIIGDIQQLNNEEKSTGEYQPKFNRRISAKNQQVKKHRKITSQTLKTTFSHSTEHKKSPTGTTDGASRLFFS
jgi:hypothetical protein